VAGFDGPLSKGFAALSMDAVLTPHFGSKDGTPFLEPRFSGLWVPMFSFRLSAKMVLSGGLTDGATLGDACKFVRGSSTHVQVCMDQ
jgi:hypothetical protein